MLGMCLGSFVGLVADRLPRRESVVRGSSRCRSCGRRLNAVDLLPVIGYLVRRGRCHGCGTAIPPLYALTEAACGAVAAGATLWLGPWPGAVLGVAGVALIGAALAVSALLRPRLS